VTARVGRASDFTVRDAGACCQREDGSERVQVAGDEDLPGSVALTAVGDDVAVDQRHVAGECGDPVLLLSVEFTSSVSPSSITIAAVSTAPVARAIVERFSST
jgi:hypothetical protein